MDLVPRPKYIRYYEGTTSPSRVCVRELPLLPSYTEQLLRSFDRGGDIPLTVRCGDDPAHEGYLLSVSQSEIFIEAKGERGVFYAAQTLKQLFAEKTIPCVCIEDAPDFTYRGFYQDVSRGRIPTLDTLKVLVDRLSALKMNSLQLYVEHTYRFKEYVGINEDLGFYTDEEILELDRYCRERYVDLVPSLSSFGHLYYLLSSKQYAHLCEIPDYQPTRHQWHERLLHHTIDPENPESLAVITSLISQYLPLFTSRCFNICCDETFDLCKGRNAGGDVAKAYAGFVSKLCTFLKERGKTVMMWSDIVMKHPEVLDDLPDDVIYLNWDYDMNANGLNAPFLEERGRQQIVCPSVHSHKRLLEKLPYAFPNIDKVASLGAAHHAFGVLVTNWGDYGHICTDECMLFGLSYGAAKSWNVAQTSYTNRDTDRAILRHVYHTDSQKVKAIIHTLNTCDELFLESFGYEKALWELTVQYFDNEHGTPLDYDRHKADLQKLDLSASRQQCATCAQQLAELMSGGMIDERIGEALTVAARGEMLIFGILDAACHDRPYSEELLSERDAWLADMKALWHRRNKPGEWAAVEEFFTVNIHR